MLIRVLEIPKPSGNLHFGGGEPQVFVEVDWFHDRDHSDPDAPSMLGTDEGRDQIALFIKTKRYFDPAKSYLILHQEHSFTINYSVP